MKIAIVGTGAIGGFYGGKLALAGNDVHFLLNSDHKHVLDNGLKVESPDGDFHLQKVNAWNNSKLMPKCDLVIIALKTTQNHLLVELLPPICHENTTILVLQNGLDSDEESAKAVPQCTILGGLCSIACSKVGPGHIRHLYYSSISMGQYNLDKSPAGITSSLTETAELFTDAGIPVKMNMDLIEARWRKLIWNMTFNGMTTILNCSTKELVDHPDTRTMAINIMNEVITLAQSEGKYIEPDFIEKMMALTDNMGAYFPSMKLDFDAGRPLEVREIYERPLQNAIKNNVSTPYLISLLYQLRFLSSVKF